MSLAVRKLLDGESWVDVVEAGLRAVQVHPTATGTRQLLEEVDATLKSGVCACVGELRPGLGRGRGARGGVACRGDGREFRRCDRGGGESRRGFGFDGVDCRAAVWGEARAVPLPSEAVYRVDVLEPLLELAREWGRVRQIKKL